MYISSKDLEILKDIEEFLFNINADKLKIINNKFVGTIGDLNNSEALDLYLKLYAINEKLINTRQKKNEIYRVKMFENRKINKMYGRSKKEIEQHERAVTNRQIKEREIPLF